jgi:hypothetical protein
MALYTAASSSEWIAVNTLNRKTGNRVNREFIDSETGDPVEREDQVKGYEVENGRYVVTSGRVTRRSGLRLRSTAPYSLATSRPDHHPCRTDLKTRSVFCHDLRVMPAHQGNH